MMMMLVLLLPVVLMFLFTNRSQSKKQKEMESKLKKGDRIVTQSGIVGKLIEPIEGKHAKLEIAPGVKITILRSAIAGLDTEDAPKTKDEPALADKK